MELWKYFIRNIARKTMSALTAVFWADKSKVFSGILACFWSVQHIACTYGPPDDCTDDCQEANYEPVVDTVATVADLGPCYYRTLNEYPTFVSSENSDYFCSEAEWLSAAEVRCEEKAPVKPFEYGSFKDPRDGYVYRLTTIGEQTWFAENLRYKTNTSYTPDEKIFNAVGRYYNRKDAQTACPTGFHLPTSEEWEELWLYVSKNNGCENVGTSLKTDSLWSEYLVTPLGFARNNEDMLSGTNRYGFNAVPAGTYTEEDGLFVLGDLTRFWADKYKTAESWVMNFWGNNFFNPEGANPNWYISVRCVMDEPASSGEPIKLIYAQ